MQGVYDSVADNPSVTDREAHWVIPLVGRGSVRISRCSAPCVILHAAADEQRLLVGQVEIQFGVMRMEMNRSRRVEAKPTRVQAVANGVVVDLVFPGGSGQSRNGGGINASDIGKDLVEVRRGEADGLPGRVAGSVAAEPELQDSLSKALGRNCLPS